MPPRLPRLCRLFVFRSLPLSPPHPAAALVSPPLWQQHAPLQRVPGPERSPCPLPPVLKARPSIGLPLKSSPHDRRHYPPGRPLPTSQALANYFVLFHPVPTSHWLHHSPPTQFFVTLAHIFATFCRQNLFSTSHWSGIVAPYVFCLCPPHFLLSLLS